MCGFVWKGSSAPLKLKFIQLCELEIFELILMLIVYCICLTFSVSSAPPNKILMIRKIRKKTFASRYLTSLPRGSRMSYELDRTTGVTLQRTNTPTASCKLDRISVKTEHGTAFSTAGQNFMCTFHFSGRHRNRCSRPQ